MAQTYTKTVTVTGDSNPNGDDYTWVDVNGAETAGWITRSNSSGNDWDFTIETWSNPGSSSRAAEFKVRHWLWTDDSQTSLWDSFTITQYNDNSINVTTTQATTTEATTTEATTTLATTTGATTQAATTTQATTIAATTTQATTINYGITLSPTTITAGENGQSSIINMGITPSNVASHVFAVASNSSSGMGAGTIAFVTDATGTTQADQPSWISSVSGNWDSSNGLGIVQFSINQVPQENATTTQSSLPTLNQGGNQNKI